MKRPRTWPLWPIAALLLLLVSTPARGDKAFLKSSTPAGTDDIVCGGADPSAYADFTSATTSSAVNVAGAETIVVSVWAKSAGTATLVIETAPTSTGPWFNVTTAAIVNPTAKDGNNVGGEQWLVPIAAWVRVRVSSYSSGTYNACIGAKRFGQAIY